VVTSLVGLIAKVGCCNH